MILGITNGKGGVGKTTLSVHLADWLRIHGCRVLLVDCDGQRLSSWYLKSARPEISIRAFDEPAAIYKELPQLSQEFDVLVADAPGDLSQVTGAILSAADAVLIPTGASGVDIRGLDWTVETIHEIQAGRGGLPATVIVPTKVVQGRRSSANLKRIAQSLHFGITDSSIWLKELFVTAAGIPDENRAGYKVEPRLVWDLGKNEEVRGAALILDQLFQEVFPEACEGDPDRILRMVTTKAKYNRILMERDGEKIRANG